MVRVCQVKTVLNRMFQAIMHAIRNIILKFVNFITCTGILKVFV